VINQCSVQQCGGIPRCARGALPDKCLISIRDSHVRDMEFEEHDYFSVVAVATTKSIIRGAEDSSLPTPPFD